MAVRACVAFGSVQNVVNFTPGGRLGGEILKCRPRSSRFLNFKRRKGFAVKEFGSRASFAKTKEHCDDRKLYGKKEFCRSR